MMNSMTPMYWEILKHLVTLMPGLAEWSREMLMPLQEPGLLSLVLMRLLSLHEPPHYSRLGCYGRSSCPVFGDFSCHLIQRLLQHSLHSLFSCCYYCHFSLWLHLYLQCYQKTLIIIVSNKQKHTNKQLGQVLRCQHSDTPGTTKGLMQILRWEMFQSVSVLI